MFEKSIEEQLHAEIIARAAKKYRCGFFRKHRGVIPVMPGVFEHFEFLDGFVKCFIVQATANNFVVQATHLHRRAKLSADGALEKMHQLRLTIVNALKIKP